MSTALQRLLELKQDLEAALDESRDSVKPVDLEAPIGRLSRIDAIQQQKLAQANRARIDLRLRQTLAAIAAYHSGEYGECKRCGEEIAPARLQARPEAPICLECQEAIESR